MALLLDTHILVWMDQGDARLGKAARAVISTAVAQSGAHICPVSFWEVAIAVERRRLALTTSLAVWRGKLLRAGYRERPIDGSDMILTATLADLHGNPADRMLTAVASNGALTPVTADRKILSWQGQVGRMDGPK